VTIRQLKPRRTSTLKLQSGEPIMATGLTGTLDDRRDNEILTLEIATIFDRWDLPYLRGCVEVLSVNERSAMTMLL